jgi:signal transduction histidine kinase
MSPPRVLIVDDDEALLEALPGMLALRMPGVAIQACSNALDAVGHLRETVYDAIISDIKMPGMDGLGLLATAREVCPETPLVLVTGHGDADLAVQALRGGAYDFVQKPIDRDYLTAALARAIETFALRRQVREQRQALEHHALHLEEIVEERTQQLVEANAAKDDFLGLVSHELRTPITVIMGNAQLLRRGETALPQADRVFAIADIHREAERLNRIVENMFVLAGRARDGVIETEPVLLQRLMTSIVEQHRVRFPHRPVVLHVEPGLPPGLGHSGYLEIVANNLLSNAEKYSPAAGPIEIEVAARGDFVEISMSDSGGGIPEQEWESIFQPFYRSAATAHSAPGIGIGLAVCRELMRAQGGDIVVSRAPNGGACFMFRITIIEPDGPEAAHAPRNGNLTKERAAEGSGAFAPGDRRHSIPR